MDRPASRGWWLTRMLGLAALAAGLTWTHVAGIGLYVDRYGWTDGAPAWLWLASSLVPALALVHFALQVRGDRRARKAVHFSIRRHQVDRTGARPHPPWAACDRPARVLHSSRKRGRKTLPPGGNAMKILRWTGWMIALAAAAVVTGCGVEVYDSPGYPGRYHPRGRYEDRSGDVQGTVLRVSRRDHVIVLDPGDGDHEGRKDRDEIVLFYDDSTTVEYQGRDYRPEDLERGDRIQATIDSRGGRPVAEDIQVIYDVSSGRGGMAPDRPGRPDREDSSGQDEPSAAALRGTVRSVDATSHTLEIETASDDSGDSDDSSDEPSGVVVVFYDARTTVQFQGRSYRPENLEEGDVVEIHLRRGRSGRLVADQILVLGEGSHASPSRSRAIGSAQTPSSRQPRISSNPATTSDQNPRLLGM